MINAKIQQSLSKRFSWAILGVVTFILLIFSTGTIFYNLSRVENHLNRELTDVCNYAQTSLPSVIWQYDTESIKEILDAIFLEDCVAYTRIRDKHEVLALKVRPSFEGKEFSFFAGSSRFIVHTADITREGKAIAQFQVAISRDSMKQGLLLNILGVIALLLTLIASIVFTSIFVTKKYIFDPLSKLGNSAASIAEGNLDTVFDIESKDEIGYLAGIFDKMRHSLKKLIGDLEEYGRNLENKVKERTEELNEKNKKLGEEREKLLNEIMERKRIEKELIVAKDKAFAATNAKSEFLANMSHEIRTPMNAILGFTELLKGESTDSRQLKRLSSIESSGKVLLGLINDMLDLSKIEAGKFELQFEPVNPSNVFKELKHIFDDKVNAKGLEFHLEIDDSIPETLILDEIRLRQVIFNLVGNAVKFTHSGYIKITVNKSAMNNETDSMNLLFSIEDTGIGIPANQLETIFEAFKQQKGQNTRKYGGTGLGLTITRRIVSILGGEITVESKVGNGSIFNVIIRDVIITSGNETAKEMEDEIAIASVRFEEATILIVDDIEFNLVLLNGFLDDPRLEIIEATNGREAIDFAKHYHPDIILMDLKMPVMNGYEAIEILKTDEQLKDIPVIFVTADAMKRKDDHSKEQKCDGFLKKPVSKRKLFEEIMRFLPHSIEEPNTAETIKNTPVEKKPTQLISAKTKARLPELISKLQNELSSEWEIINNEFIFSEIEKFAKKIITLGEEYELDMMLHWGEKLLDEATHFDMETLPDTLLYFPELTKELKTLHQESGESA
ncbi:MAG: response regulator [bacterium]|nr:response regulator [bacterium]